MIKIYIYGSGRLATLFPSFIGLKLPLNNVYTFDQCIIH